MRLQCHQHAESSALFFTETSINSITAFSSPSWQAGWWNNVPWFSENCLQINLGETRGSPFSTSIRNRGLGWCWQQLLRQSFCSCQIILQPESLVPRYQTGLVIIWGKPGSQAFLSPVVFVICAVYVSSQFTLVGEEWHLDYHLNTRINYWTHLATIQVQPLNRQKSIHISFGELHCCGDFLWGCLTVNNNTETSWVKER